MMMHWSMGPVAVVAAALFALPTNAAPRGLPADACATVGAGTSNAKRPGTTPRGLSADTAETMAAIDAMGGVGGAAPNADADAMLDMLTSLMGSRDDADSQAAAAMMRKQTGRSGTMSPDAQKRARAALGC
jgi:hypothetical protein